MPAAPLDAAGAVSGDATPRLRTDDLAAVDTAVSGLDSVSTTVELAPVRPDDELLRKKQRLARLVVHDLRNPLAALQGHLELISEDLVGCRVPDAVTLGLEDSSALVAKVLALVASILDVEELEEGVLRSRPVATEVEGLLRRAVAVNQPAMRIRQLRFDLDVPAGLVAWLDPELMYRVLENLFDNAVRWAPRGGRVAVWAHLTQGEVEIAIGNDGPPVPDADRDRIFDRYYRIEERRAGARAGRGLGLYFCKLAVEAQGGSLGVERRGELGAVFVARLPHGG